MGTGSPGERFFSPWVFHAFTNPRQIGTPGLPWLPGSVSRSIGLYVSGGGLAVWQDETFELPATS